MEVAGAAPGFFVRIMQPVRETAGSATHLLLAPEGALNLAPFGALMDEHNQFLVERYSVRYLSRPEAWS